MKRLKWLLISLFFIFVCFLSFGQEVTDTSVSITYTFGDSIKEFIQKNFWTLIFVIFTIISEWLGQTNKIKEGSIWAWTINLIGKMLRKKTDLVATKKAKFMSEAQFKTNLMPKILIFALLFSGISYSSYAQKPWNGFFKVSDGNPLIVNMLDHNVKIRQDVKAGLVGASEESFIDHAWVIRPSVGVLGNKISYNSESNELESSGFNAVALGVGYQKYKDIEGESINTLGVNVLLFLSAPEELIKAEFSVAATLHALKLLDFGIGRDFALDRWFVLTGLSYSF